MGTKDPVIVPYQVVETQDGYLNLAIGNDKLFHTFCMALGLDELANDERFSTNKGRVEHRRLLEPILEDLFKTKPTDAWVQLLAEEHQLPVSPVLQVGEALNLEQTKVRGTVLEMDHPSAGKIQVLNLPFKYHQAETGFDRPPPLLGQDTDEVLQTLGYDTKQIEALRAENVI